MKEELKIVYVNTESINDAGFNPPSRTNIKNMETLKKEIGESGILVPLALTKNGILADGHRRKRAAEELGIKKVPCIYHNTTDPMALWSRLNRATKPITPTNWLEVYMNGMPIDQIPPRHRSQIVGMERILTKEEFEQFAGKHRSPGILDSAYRIAHKCGDTSDVFVHEIVLWSMEFEQMHLLNHAIREGMEVNKVIEVILNREKLHKGWI